MGKKSMMKVLIIMVANVLFFAVCIHAGTTVPEVIRMENKAYKKHKKGIVLFSHKQHIEAYQIGCGECHHDKNGKPLADLKEGDDVKNCISCHKTPGQAPKKIKKEWKANKLTKAEIRKNKLEYHAEAMHFNCIGCHKMYNKKNHTKKAPATCSKCHPKKKP